MRGDLAFAFLGLFVFSFIKAEYSMRKKKIKMFYI